MHKWLDGLPRTLKFLSLTCEALDSSLFSSMHEFSNLTTFKISTEQNPKDEWQHCFDHAPPNITSIAFRVSSKDAKTSLTNESFRNLPPSITSIVLPSSPRLDKAYYSQLPNLNSLFIGVDKVPLLRGLANK
jgi:hypothetical protein